MVFPSTPFDDFFRPSMVAVASFVATVRTYLLLAIQSVQVNLLGSGTAKQLDYLKDSIGFTLEFNQLVPKIKKLMAFKTSQLVIQESLLNLDS